MIRILKNICSETINNLRCGICGNKFKHNDKLRHFENRSHLTYEEKGNKGFEIDEFSNLVINKTAKSLDDVEHLFICDNCLGII